MFSSSVASLGTLAAKTAGKYNPEITYTYEGREIRAPLLACIDKI
nr:hypothetical protein [Candidatus Anoxychlamydiales bacterium]